MKRSAGLVPAEPGFVGAASDAFSLSLEGARALAGDPLAGPGGAGRLAPVVPVPPMPRVPSADPVTAPAAVPIASAAGARPATEIPVAPPFPVGLDTAAPAAAGPEPGPTRDELVDELREESRLELEERERELLAEWDRSRTAVIREVEAGREQVREQVRERTINDAERMQLERASTERMQASSTAELRNTVREHDELQHASEQRTALAGEFDREARVESSTAEEIARTDGVERDRSDRDAELEAQGSARQASGDSAAGDGEHELTARAGARGADEPLAEGRSEAGPAGRGGEAVDPGRARGDIPGTGAREAAHDAGRSPEVDLPSSSTEALAAALEALGDESMEGSEARPTGPAVTYRNSVEREPDSVLDDLYG